MGIRHTQVVFGWAATTLGYILRADMTVAILAMTDGGKSKNQNATDSGSIVRKKTSTHTIIILHSAAGFQIHIHH